MRHRLIFMTLLALSAGFASCKKEGLGGKASISGVVAHHSEPIPNAIVYIKYGSESFPGTNVSVYDDWVQADQLGVYAFNTLYKGDYYLYGVGYDSLVSDSVFGGIPVTLKRKDALSTNVPVTE